MQLCIFVDYQCLVSVYYSFLGEDARTYIVQFLQSKWRTKYIFQLVRYVPIIKWNALSYGFDSINNEGERVQ